MNDVVKLESGTMFDHQAWTAHLRWEHLLWQHSTLKNLPPWQETRICHWLRGEKLTPGHDGWLFHPNTLLRNRYHDFRCTLGLQVYPDKPVSGVCLATHGYLYGAPRAEWYDDITPSAVMS